MLCVWHPFWDCCLAWGCLFTWVPHSTLLRFFSLYVIILACVVMLHMGCPIAALFVQAHNWKAVIWLAASAKATTFCPYSPAAAADVRILCACVCMFVRCIYIWKSFDVIIHVESQGNWPSSVGLVALSQGRIVLVYTHTHMYTKTGISGWVLPNQWDIGSVPFIMCYQLTSLHNRTNTSTQLILSPNNQ